MKKVVIVHGYTGHPGKNWFPWLKSELENLGVGVEVPAMPNSNAPKLNEWLPHLQTTIGMPDDDTHLIGHSLGCPTILRYLENMHNGQKVGGVLLVAGFAEPLPELPELDSFTEGAWNDEKIKSKANKIVIMNSDDDPAVPYVDGEHVRDRFNAELVTIHKAGHINEKFGYTEVPFVLDKIKVMMGI